MTKLRYPFGVAAVRQPCAVCTGSAYECSTKPLERLPVLETTTDDIVLLMAELIGGE